MPDAQFDCLFPDKERVKLMPVRDLVDWFGSNHRPRLRLPPIQRSLVWRNEQILNYWDSLLRGYPAGTMMVHRTIPSTPGEELVARDINNETKPVEIGDFQLFDGQQRLSAILLGFGKGQLSQSLKLWIDLGKPQGGGERLFELRINSEGQPFGYQPEKPNEKLPLEERRKSQEEWMKGHGAAERTSPSKIFETLTRQEPAELSRARYAVSLAAVIDAVQRGDAELAELFSDQRADQAAVSRVVKSIQTALSSEIILQLVRNEVLEEAEYVRFFGRLGQGGTRLTDEELTYCLIKNRYPHIHDRMQKIVAKTGRFLSEVDLVLGALRVAKAIRPWKDAKEWEQRNRPTPKLIEELRQQNKRLTEEFFLTLVPAKTDDSAISGVLVGLKAGLSMSEAHFNGVPTMMLARLPRDLLDVLLLFSIKRGEASWEGADRNVLTAFVLHWLCFVSDDSEASYHCYGIVTGTGWAFGKDTIAHLMRSLESERFARLAPRQHHWRLFEEQVHSRDDKMASWEERFTAARQEDGPDPGYALRVLSTHPEIKKCVLLWLQRTYITKAFPDYDPTSTRDDDLPFDLDHAIPHVVFGDDWRNTRKGILKKLPDGELRQSFKDHRNTIGNSLGNLRWLESSDNRRRGRRPLEPVSESLPSIADDLDRDSWNPLIERQEWSEDDVATFQRLIDLRTLRLAKRYVEESGIASLLATDDAPADRAAIRS